MLNPIGIIESFVKKVERLEARVKELEEALAEVSPLVESLVSLDGAKFLVSVPKKWGYLFETFITYKVLENALKDFIFDYTFSYVQARDVPVDYRKVEVNPDKILHIISSKEE